MKENILSKPDEIVGGFVKDLLSIVEERLLKFGETGEVSGLTKDDVTKVASKWGLESCGYQLYFLALGFYTGSLEGYVPNFCKDMACCRDCGEAAIRLSEKLGVPVNEVDAKEALKYYENKN